MVFNFNVSFNNSIQIHPKINLKYSKHASLSNDAHYINISIYLFHIYSYLRKHSVIYLKFLFDFKIFLPKYFFLFLNNNLKLNHKVF